MYEEVPVSIKNSPLTNMLLLKLQKENPVPETVRYLNLSHRYVSLKPGLPTNSGPRELGTLS